MIFNFLLFFIILLHNKSIQVKKIHHVYLLKIMEILKF